MTDTLADLRRRHGSGALDRPAASDLVRGVLTASEFIGRKVARTDTGLAFRVEAISVGTDATVYVLGSRLSDGVGAAAPVELVQGLR